MKNRINYPLLSYYIGKYSRRYRIWYYRHYNGRGLWGIIKYGDDSTYMDEYKTTLSSDDCWTMEDIERLIKDVKVKE